MAEGERVAQRKPGRATGGAQEVTAMVAAWQNGAISRETMLHRFRRGEALPEGRTDDDEARLIGSGAVGGSDAGPVSHAFASRDR